MEEQDISFGRRLRICLRMLSIAWKLRPIAIVGYFIGVTTEIASMLVSIYATAKLASLLAVFVTNGHTTDIWFWLWADIVAVGVTGLSFLIMNYCKRMIYFAFVRWDINSFLHAVSQFDLADFYNTETRNQLNKIGGAYIWQLPNLSDICLDL